MERNSNMDQLTQMPNIGKALAQQLMEIGIDTPQKLMDTGTEKAFILLKGFDPSACFCKLCAIDGAIKNVRWHNLPESDKATLKEFYRMMNKA